MAIRAAGFTVLQLGPHQEMTPEGFLLCLDVPVARTGMMLYGPDETPVPAGLDGVVKIFREESSVFDPKTMASGIGKTVTIQHPEVDVTPENWKEEAVGTALSVRRGKDSADEEDLLLMDLIIQDAAGIRAIQDGLIEISLGYDAEYEYDDEVPGVGYQKNIIINHIALVEKGRCGPRCAIKDELPTNNTKANNMSRYHDKKPAKLNKSGLRKVVDLLFRARSAKDEEEFQEVVEGAMDALEQEEFQRGDEVENQDDIGPMPDEEVHIHIDGQEDEETIEGNAPFQDDAFQEHITQNAAEHAQFAARLAAIEQQLGITDASVELPGAAESSFDDNEELENFLEDEAPEGVPAQDARKARDSALLVDSFQDTVSQAEILVPGIKIPQFDRANTPAKSASQICALRKKALRLGYNTADSHDAINDILRGKTLDTSKMTCDAARTLFNAAVASKKASNTASLNVRDSLENQTQKTNSGPRKILTQAELNQFNAVKWGRK